MNSDLNENLCDSFMHCFLTFMNYGIRGGSIGFSLKAISEDGYWIENGFEWVFFFSIGLIFMNVINGIIVDTFQDLRETENSKNDISENVCYICSTSRSDCEVKGLNFHNHRTIDHQILYYLVYIHNVRSQEKKNLGSIDAKIYKAVEDDNADFFPTY